MFGLGKKKGPQEVSLNSDQYKFEVDPDQNILDAAYFVISKNSKRFFMAYLFGFLIHRKLSSIELSMSDQHETVFKFNWSFLWALNNVFSDTGPNSIFATSDKVTICLLFFFIGNCLIVSIEL